MLSMWFKHETGLMMMIGILTLTREELDKANFFVDGERAENEIWKYAAKRNLWHERRGCFSNVSRKPKEIRSMSKPFSGNLQVHSLLEWDHEDKGNWQPTTNARAKVTRMKVRKSTKMWVEGMYRF